MMLFESSATNCSAAALPYPSVFGALVLALSASLVTNFSTIARGEYNPNHDTIHASNLSFCNITVDYTHPGQNDHIVTQVWLPISTWNGRMQAVGGGGWQAGLMPYSYIAMAAAAAEGYAAVTTDGGHHSSAEPTDWALLGPGNVDFYTLQNFGSRSLNDSATIGKSLIQDFYGEPAKFSYWSGCSQGGRQGLMLAQRYPTVFDGIAASAPATNWAEFMVGGFWPQLVMNEMQEYPYPCELDALTLAAINACDADDGVRDGIIAEPDSCQFDAYTAVGTSIHCKDTGSEIKISKAAAAVAEAAWTGAKTSDGRFLWYGVGHSANLTSFNSLAGTQCFPNGTCIGKPVSLITDFIRLFVKKDPSYDISNITRHEYEGLFHAAVQEYTSIIGTNYPDLSEFRNSGGKMIAYHGQASFPPHKIHRLAKC